MQLCSVCSEHVPKYRCPICRVRYCSVGCFRRHKEIGSCRPVIEPEQVSSTAAPIGRAEEPWTVEDLLDEEGQSDRVPLEKLQQLGHSEALKDLLRNPHLRRLVTSVDSAEDKARAMREAMQEPLFVEFADQCLRIIEPEETQMNDYEDDDD
ncbi:hypothetical protein DNTS_003274 [Danionella cerebrum]|uniref:Zinc finger HIT domain-containing protein 3 n=1 Tax=Danionella cerebrum TaxID=2873325 RepID=A0A553MVG7_9TELE|nr:hypothetical protein DNTS_003274 [Danionella translucida]